MIQAKHQIVTGPCQGLKSQDSKTQNPKLDEFEVQEQNKNSLILRQSITLTQNPFKHSFTKYKYLLNKKMKR